MRRPINRVRAVTTAWMLAGCVVFGAASTIVAADLPAAVGNQHRAQRAAASGPSIDSTTRRITVVGDSILFTRLQPGVRQNAIVPLARAALTHHHAGVRVRNLSLPGLSTLHRLSPRATTLRPHLLEMLESPGPPPDVVVIVISSIDINLFPSVSVRSLAPALIGELRAIERLLHDRGVDALFVPAFGINGDMYNSMRSRFDPWQDHRFDERVNLFNDFVRKSGLPLLFDRFVDLDRDGDGNADRHYFVDYDPLGGWPDDGIHPNALGERVYGDNLANGLLAAFERS